MNEPRVLAFYRPSRVNGVAAAGARAACLPRPWRPAIIGAGDPAEMRSQSPLAGSPGLDATAWNQGESAASQVIRVAEAIIASQVSVVVPNDLPVAFVAAALLRHRGVRTASWIHSDHLDGEDLVARCLELADSWAAVSGSATRHALRTASQHSLRVAKPSEPVWACTELPQAPPPIARDSGTFRLLYAGRIERMVKRTDDLVHLVRGLRASGVCFEMTIAGTGPAETYVRRELAAEIANGIVRMPGAVPLAEMPELVAAHDMIVLVSESEGMPNIVMEAFARGRPAVLTSGCGGATDLVEREGCTSGLVFPTGDMAAMAAGVAQLAGDRSRLARMGRAAREIAERVFDVRVVGCVYDALIDAALSESAPPNDDAVAWRRIKRALSGIEGATRTDAAELWRWWGKTGGVPGGSRPGDWFEIPVIESPAERRARGVLESLRAESGGRIALYGAGLHTRRIASVVHEFSEVVQIIDDAPSAATCIGLPVVHPAGIGDDVRAVVVSSDEHERGMLTRAAAFAGNRVVRGLYTVQQPESSAYSL